MFNYRGHKFRRLLYAALSIGASLMIACIIIVASSRPLLEMSITETNINKINNDSNDEIAAVSETTKPQTISKEVVTIVEEVIESTEPTETIETTSETEPKRLYETKGSTTKYVGMEMDLPMDIPRTFKCMAAYKALRSDNPVQKIAYTDEQGFRRVGQYYAVAMGTYYTNRLGDLFHIKTEGGEYDVIITDTKSDKHTDEKHMYSRVPKCMCEFCVDLNIMDKNAKLRGSCDLVRTEFNGAIISVVFMGNYFDGDGH